MTTQTTTAISQMTAAHIDPAVETGRKILKYELDYGFGEGGGSGGGCDGILCCCCVGGCSGGDARAIVVGFLIASAVILALSSFISWAVTLSSASKLHCLRERVEECLDEIRHLPQSVQNRIFGNNNKENTPEYAIAEIYKNSLEVTQYYRDEMAIRCTFQATISLGLTLLTITAVIALLAYLNIFHSPFTLMVLASSGSSTLALGIAGYSINAIAHSLRGEKESVKTQTKNLILNQFDPKGYLEMHGNIGNYSNTWR